MFTRTDDRESNFRGGMLAVALLLGFVLWAAGPAVADDKPQEKPRPMSELARELGEVETRVLGFDADVERIRKGRLKELFSETLKLTREVSKAKLALKRFKTKVEGKIKRKCEKALRKIKRERDKAIKTAKKTRDRHCSGSGCGSATSASQKKYEDAYKTARDAARKTYRDKRDKLKLAYDSEIEDVLEEHADKLDEYKSTIDDGGARLKEISDERAILLKNIADINREARPFKRTLLRLRREVAKRPEEAMANGLRPRGARYVFGESNSKLTLSGGVWGKPCDNDLWKKSDEMQARGLLSLARRKKEAGEPALAKLCIEKLLKELPDTAMAAPAKKLLAEL